MRLVLANAGDEIARSMAAALGSATWCVTPRELSRAGWIHDPTGNGDDVIVIGGERMPARAVSAVITRLAAVLRSDLPHIVEDDRDYVAAEMTAFLLSFLIKLPCPVINTPSAGSLMGPSWSALRWRAAATQAGFAPALDPQARGELVVVVGERAVGAASPRTERSALALARTANVQLLGLRVVEADGDPQLVGVEPWCEPPPAALELLEIEIAKGRS
jgi:hypothetical protein